MSGIDHDAWAREDYAGYALDRDLKYVKKFVQSNCRYKTSYYERTKWDAYGAAHRILRGQRARTLLDLIAILDANGIRYKPGRVATRVLAEARS